MLQCSARPVCIEIGEKGIPGPRARAMLKRRFQPCASAVFPARRGRRSRCSEIQREAVYQTACYDGFSCCDVFCDSLRLWHCR